VTAAAPTNVIAPERSVAGHLADIWSYRELLANLVRKELKVKYKNSVLGFLWSLLNPISQVIVFTVVFQIVLKNTIPFFPIFLLSGMLAWNLFALSLAGATGSITGNHQLVNKVYFPREILPLTYVIAALFDFAIGFGVLLALMGWYHFPLTVHAWAIVPIVGILCAWTLAVSLFLAAVQVRIRDIGIALPVLLQVLMFASPIIYPLTVVPAAWREWYLLNPMAGIVSAFRDVLLHQRIADPHPLTVACAVTVVVLPAMFLFFKRAEATMADLI